MVFQQKKLDFCLKNYNYVENTTINKTEKSTEEIPSVIEVQELQTLIIASIETLKQQKMKHRIDEVLNLIQDSLEGNISGEFWKNLKISTGYVSP